MSSGQRACILIPTRNEHEDIIDCLEAIGQQSVPLSELEVIVVDGDSSDGTADLARAWLRDSEFARSQVINNPDATTPSNLNAGLASVTAPIVCRVDARSRIPPTYVERCAEVLDNDRSLVVVGGSQTALARDRSSRALGVARALNNRWGMGLSRYRRGGSSGLSETVYLGAFRTEDLNAVNGWDIRLPTNQDFDLNQRLGRIGDIWFIGDLSVGYIPRSSVAELFRQYYRFGDWKARYWQITGTQPQPRQRFIMFGPLVLAAGAAGLLARRRTRAPALITLLAGAVAVEHGGSSGPDGGLGARMWSVSAMAAVALGWLGGVWQGMLGRGR